MKATIIEEKENQLLGRKEVVVGIENDGPTPKNEELIGQICALLNTKKELVVVETISQKFGVQRSLARVRIYNSEDALKAVEPQKKAKEEKPAPVAEEKPAEAPAEAPAEEPKEEAPAEAPAEEKKEEAPAEEKKEEKPEEKPPEGE